MELMFIRHAQNERDATTDPPLSALGRGQAERLGERARTWAKPEALFVSPSLRAQETAAPLSSALDIPAITVAWLREIDLPPGSKIATRGVGVPDAELLGPFRERVTEGLLATMAERGARPVGAGRWRISEPARRLVFVGHGGANAVAMESILGLEVVPWIWYRFTFAHASISRMKTFPLDDGSFAFGLVRHGDVGHLPKELRSG
jgi:probable phosphoglycerate mutase